MDEKVFVDGVIAVATGVYQLETETLTFNIMVNSTSRTWFLLFSCGFASSFF